MKKYIVLTAFLLTTVHVTSPGISREDIKSTCFTIVSGLTACAATAIITESFVTGKAMQTIMREAFCHTAISNRAAFTGFAAGIIAICCVQYRRFTANIPKA